MTLFLMLPLHHTGIFIAGALGFEPRNSLINSQVMNQPISTPKFYQYVKDLCLTEPKEELESPTFALQVRCSTS